MGEGVEMVNIEEGLEKNASTRRENYLSIGGSVTFYAGKERAKMKSLGKIAQKEKQELVLRKGLVVRIQKDTTGTGRKKETRALQRVGRPHRGGVMFGKKES